MASKCTDLETEQAIASLEHILPHNLAEVFPVIQQRGGKFPYDGVNHQKTD